MSQHCPLFQTIIILTYSELSHKILQLRVSKIVLPPSLLKRVVSHAWLRHQFEWTNATCKWNCVAEKESIIVGIIERSMKLAIHPLVDVYSRSAVFRCFDIPEQNTWRTRRNRLSFEEHEDTCRLSQKIMFLFVNFPVCQIVFYWRHKQKCSKGINT